MAEHQKKRPLVREKAESGSGKKSSILPVTCSPVAAGTSTLLAAPSPVAKAKPAAKAALTSPVAVIPPALAPPSPAAMMAPATPSNEATKTLTPATPSPVVTTKPEDKRAKEACEASVNVDLPKKWLHCAVCPAPLKPPVFKCWNGHYVCSACGGDGEGGAKKHCGPCGGRDVPYIHFPFMDGLGDDCKVPCPYKSFGCQRSVAYHSLADHKAMCGHAPCYCRECTPPFEGSPADLLRHLTAPSGKHSWPTDKIKYESSYTFVVQPEDYRCLLVAEDGGVFLLAVGAGRGLPGRRTVNVVCVRGNTDADTRPLYTGVLWVDGPPAPQGQRRCAFRHQATVASCSVPGEVDMEQGWLHAHVNPSMLQGESGEVHLRLSITNYP